MANLTLVPPPVDVEVVETDVLKRAIEDIGQWIASLPTTSSWRFSFVRARANLLDELHNRRES
jgi:hypothetical protein